MLIAAAAVRSSALPRVHVSPSPPSPGRILPPATSCSRFLKDKVLGVSAGGESDSATPDCSTLIVHELVLELLQPHLFSASSNACSPTSVLQLRMRHPPPTHRSTQRGGVLNYIPADVMHARRTFAGASCGRASSADASTHASRHQASNELFMCRIHSSITSH